MPIQNTNVIIITNKLQIGKYKSKARAWFNTCLDEFADQLTGKAADILEPHQFKKTLWREAKAERFETERSVGINAFVGSGSIAYAQVIHDQRVHPARWPPTEPIREWVEKRLGVPRTNKKFEGIVFCVRRNIARNGLKTIGPDGLKFFWKPMSENYQDWMRRIAAGLKRLNL
jgi:hypothetical protein